MLLKECGAELIRVANQETRDVITGLRQIILEDCDNISDLMKFMIKRFMLEKEGIFNKFPIIMDTLDLVHPRAQVKHRVYMMQAEQYEDTDSDSDMSCASWGSTKA
ncbi:unnamed protein product [Bursaphelenchus okinawaensis]|uniref:Uncharacterized protein n=1 Tax=Bursaphelenchus okinawaensis TaxID=465554 RepID=A0A811KY39_9BILA|nr:unnamed protein product [Bursaphelenchus okinawaensis]CAG9112895.1 unnamed protein product [Bursaphelenchus okinawaensis]